MVLLLNSAPRSLDLIPGGEAAHFTMLVRPHEWLVGWATAMTLPTAAPMVGTLSFAHPTAFRHDQACSGHPRLSCPRRRASSNRRFQLEPRDHGVLDRPPQCAIAHKADDDKEQQIEKGRLVAQTAFPFLRQPHISGRFQEICTGGLSPGRFLLGGRCSPGQSRTGARHRRDGFPSP